MIALTVHFALGVHAHDAALCASAYIVHVQCTFAILTFELRMNKKVTWRSSFVPMLCFSLVLSDCQVFCLY